MPPVNTCACSSVDRAPASDAGLSQVRFLSSVPKETNTFYNIVIMMFVSFYMQN